MAGDDAYYSRLHAAAPQLAIFAPGHELAHARRLGAVGSYSNVACMAPAGALAWERQMDRDPDGAEELGARIMAFFDTYIAPLKAGGYSNTALDKALAAVGGLGTDRHPCPVALQLGTGRGGRGVGATGSGGSAGTILTRARLAYRIGFVYCQHCSNETDDAGSVTKYKGARGTNS